MTDSSDSVFLAIPNAIFLHLKITRKFRRSVWMVLWSKDHVSAKQLGMERQDIKQTSLENEDAGNFASEFSGGATLSRTPTMFMCEVTSACCATFIFYHFMQLFNFGLLVGPPKGVI